MFDLQLWGSFFFIIFEMLTPWYLAVQLWVIQIDWFGWTDTSLYVRTSKEWTLELRKKLLLRHRSGKVPQTTVSIIRKWRNFGTTRTLPKAGHSINPDKSLQLPFPPEKTVNHLNGLLDCEKQDPLDFKPSLNLSPRVHHVWRKQNSAHHLPNTIPTAKQHHAVGVVFSIWTKKICREQWENVPQTQQSQPRRGC